MTYETLILEKKDNICIITLNRPERLNAINFQLTLDLEKVISEIEVCGAIIGIHGGGEGKRTRTGLSFQVADVVEGAAEVVAAGGQLSREPQPEDDEPPHLAMCIDPEGNDFMLSRKRG